MPRYPSYPFYVVDKATGQVLSGWHYREDAKEAITETHGDRARASMQVLTKAGVVRAFGRISWAARKNSGKAPEAPPLRDGSVVSVEKGSTKIGIAAYAILQVESVTPLGADYSHSVKVVLSRLNGTAKPRTTLYARHVNRLSDQFVTLGDGSGVNKIVVKRYTGTYYKSRENPRTNPAPVEIEVTYFPESKEWVARVVDLPRRFIGGWTLPVASKESAIHWAATRAQEATRVEIDRGNFVIVKKPMQWPKSVW